MHFSLVLELYERISTRFAANLVGHHINLQQSPVIANNINKRRTTFLMGPYASNSRLSLLSVVS